MIEKSITIAILTYSIFILYKDGMLLSIVGDILHDVKNLCELNNYYILKYICKPLGVCATCMTSLYGSAFSLIVFKEWHITIILSAMFFTYWIAAIDEFLTNLINNIGNEDN